MTIRSMKRALATLLVVFALTSCGESGSTDALLKDEEARKLASDSMRAVDLLEERAAELEAEIETLRSEKDDAAERLDTISGRLWSSLSKLRESLNEAKEGNAAALSEASSAAGQAASAARSLTILENRFEYHLRQHGGG